MKIPVFLRINSLCLCLSILLGIALISSACTFEGEPVVAAENYSCLSPVEYPDSPERVGKTSQALYAGKKKLWVTPDLTKRKIRVCWNRYYDEHHVMEDGTKPDPTPANLMECRKTIREWVEKSWGKVLADPHIPGNEHYGFIGWEDECEVNADGKAPRDSKIHESVRISIHDVAPFTLGIGTDLRGGRMELNCTFQKWDPGCNSKKFTNEECIGYIAVHEFGHVLGFAHEHNRPDKSNCNEPPQGPDGDYSLGRYDPHSIMNYCNPAWNNHGYVSPTDWLGAQAAYYGERFDFKCLEEVNGVKATAALKTDSTVGNRAGTFGTASATASGSVAVPGSAGVLSPVTVPATVTVPVTAPIPVTVPVTVPAAHDKWNRTELGSQGSSDSDSSESDSSTEGVANSEGTAIQ